MSGAAPAFSRARRLPRRAMYSAGPPGIASPSTRSSGQGAISAATRLSRTERAFKARNKKKSTTRHTARWPPAASRYRNLTPMDTTSFASKR